MAKDNNTHVEFLQMWFSNCEGNIEIRLLPGGEQAYFSINNLSQLDAFIQKKHHKDNYFGCATRNGEGGTKAHIIDIPGVWADIDFKTLSQKQADKLLKQCPLPATFLIESGGGYHVYWQFKEPTNNIKIVEQINRQLAEFFTSDFAVCDASHILRIPGTLNYKYDPPRHVNLLTTDLNRQYNQSDFEKHLPPLKTVSNNTTANPQGWQDEVLKGVQSGNRHAAAAKLIGRYINKGLSDVELFPILERWDNENNPPILQDYGVDELQKIIQSIRKTDNRNHAGEKRSRAIKLIDLEQRFHTTTDWLWRTHIPHGQPIIFNGREGIGKTTTLMVIAKELLNENSTGSILWLATEGKVLDCVNKMRKIGLTERFYVAQKSDESFMFNFLYKSNLQELDTILSDLEQPILAVFVDSIRGMTSLGDNDDKLGGVMNGVNSVVCDKYGAALVYVDHWGKGQKTTLLDRNVGTTAKTAAVSAVISIITRTKYTRDIISSKSNIGEIPDLISTQIGDGIRISQPSEDSTETLTSKAENFLLQFVEPGEAKLATDVYRAAERNGINTETLKKIKRKLGIISEQASVGEPWSWRWPA
jgi:DNA polymerase III delta prime subunit